MRSLHVLTRKEDLDPAHVADTVVIVLAVLFATSTIVTALEHGVREVIPAINETAARAQAAHYPAGRAVLAGGHRANRIAGLTPYAPLALVDFGLHDKPLIYTTTNARSPCDRPRTHATFTWLPCSMPRPSPRK